MTLPKQVQKQSEDVQALYKELNTEPEKKMEEQPEANGVGLDAPEKELAKASPEVPVEGGTTATSDSVEEQAPTSEADEHSTADTQGTKDTWEQKYKTLQGMYNADIPRLNGTNRELNNRVSQLETLLGTINKQEATINEAPVEKLITEDDVKEYGDSIDIMRKAAKEEFAGESARVNKLEQELRQLQMNVVPQVQQVQMEQKTSSENAFWNTLNQEVPNWNEINSDQNFQSWLLDIDPLTGVSRQTYLEDAQKKLDAGRVVNFFNTWAQANGKVDDARENRKAQTQLAKQVAPGRGRAGQPVSGEGKTYTTKDITKFFEDVRFGKFKGREDEKKRMERDIFVAQREGRITS
tara:strand:+ start:1398 stop:2453 length:1056 start_codon:yes stop_codon:yes gene_type:complete